MRLPVRKPESKKKELSVNYLKLWFEIKRREFCKGFSPFYFINPVVLIHFFYSLGNSPVIFTTFANYKILNHMNKNSELTAFNDLFLNYKERFVRFANTYVRDQAAAEDFVIDSLIYYWENRYRLNENTNIPAYVLTTIKHKCLNYLQQQRRHEEVAEKLISHAQWELQTRISTLEACEPYELFTAEAEEIVNRTLESLPERTRQIFIMSRMQNKSYQEIANQFGITTKGVEFHITKALKELRISLKDYLPVFLYLFFY